MLLLSRVEISLVSLKLYCFYLDTCFLVTRDKDALYFEHEHSVVYVRLNMYKENCKVRNCCHSQLLLIDTQVLLLL